MNIFYLDSDSRRAAHDHADRHCVKMIVEYAQVQSTAHWIAHADDRGLLPWSGTWSSLWLHMAEVDFSKYGHSYDEVLVVYKLQRLLEAATGGRSYPKRIRKLDVLRTFLAAADSDSLYARVYNPTHINHPSAVWARSSISQYRWLCSMALELCSVYTQRYTKPGKPTKIHKTQAVHEWLRDNEPNLPDKPFTEPPQCMPDDVKIIGDTVEAYRNYYRVHKSYMAEWRYSQEPGWWS